MKAKPRHESALEQAMESRLRSIEDIANTALGWFGSDEHGRFVHSSIEANTIYELLRCIKSTADVTSLGR